MKVYRTDEIRNVVLLGHGGSGKTSLLDTLAAYLDVITHPAAYRECRKKIRTKQGRVAKCNKSGKCI